MKDAGSHCEDAVPVLLAWAVKVEWLNSSHLEKVRCHTISLSNGPRGHRHCSRSGKRDAVRRFRLSKSWAHLSKMSSSSEAENRSAAEDELSFWDLMPQPPVRNCASPTPLLTTPYQIPCLRVVEREKKAQAHALAHRYWSRPCIGRDAWPLPAG